MTDIVLIDMDNHWAIYVDGKLNFYDDAYNADLAYGLKLGSKYPDYKLTTKWPDYDWLEEIAWDIPENLEDFKTK